MTNKLILVFVGMLICFGSQLSLSAYGQHHRCKKCGCSEKPTSKLCLVRKYKQVSIPDYDCVAQETFYPDKGMTWKQRHQTDSFVVQRKDRCGESCLTCECKNECQCLAAARPTGCYQTTAVRQPAGSTIQWLPVVKWEKIPVCSKCGAYQTAHSTIVDTGEVEKSPKPDEPTAFDAELPPVITAKEAATASYPDPSKGMRE